MSDTGLATPVAFIVFNRPEHTAQSFARIRTQRPDRLFIIADGPRPDHPTDHARCREVRQIVEDIDWPCSVHRIYAEHNLGCRGRVSSGLHEVFSHAETAIVIEDDCVPDEDFFRFCTSLLSRYQDDIRVAAVTGDNFQDGHRRTPAAYYFSKYVHVWGWACWARSWQAYDDDLSFWPTWRESRAFAELHPDPIERRHWMDILDRTHRREIDTWDYVFLASTWYHGGLTATPNSNLVSNIGFGPDATHTKTAKHQPDRATKPLGQIIHPSTVEQDTEADRYAFNHHFGGTAIRQRSRPLGFLWWAATGAARRLKRLVTSCHPSYSYFVLKK